MKLLILTQKVDVNDELLGFFHDWLKEFSKRCEQVTVICLYKGEFDLPPNVKVISLGKEGGVSRIKYLKNFYEYIRQERRNYDTVFVHMNPEYVVLGGIFWRLWHKRIALWFLHKSVNYKLRIAEKLSDIIFTASKESFQLKSGKVQIVGHGIDTDKFVIAGKAGKSGENGFKIIYVGRISPIKNQELLIKAVDILVNDYKLTNFKIDLIGQPIYPRDKEYEKDLKELIKDRKLGEYINFLGKVHFNEVQRFFQNADLSINLCPTGGMDKTVLESMACGTPCLALNTTFYQVFGNYADKFILQSDNPKELAERIIEFTRVSGGERERMGEGLRKIVVENHNLSNLIDRIVRKLEENI